MTKDGTRGRRNV